MRTNSESKHPNKYKSLFAANGNQNERFILSDSFVESLTKSCELAAVFGPPLPKCHIYGIIMKSTFDC